MLTLKEAKEYLRVDESYTDEDDLIQGLINVAENYIMDGVTDYQSKIDNKIFQNKVKMVERMMVQHFYDERYLIGDNNTGKDFTYPFRSMIAQMNYGDYPPEDKNV